MDNSITSTKENIFATSSSVSDVVEYTNGEFGTIRTVTVNGEPWFCLGDLCKALDLTAKEVNRRLSDEVVSKHPIADSLGRTQNTLFVNEDGMYDVVLESRKENAKKFRKWVTSEILPTIRKTGGYVSNEDLFVNTYLPFADESTKVLFAQTLKTVREQNELIQQQKQEIMHKEDVIIGLVDDIDLATKRQRITQIVRHCKNKNYKERYTLLYNEFERKYHCDLKWRMGEHALKPKAKNTMDYIDRGMDMIPQLYEIACKLFENDVEALKAEWDYIVA